MSDLERDNAYNIQKFNVIAKNAYVRRDRNSIEKLASLYFKGEYVSQNELLSDYIKSISEGIRKEKMFQYFIPSPPKPVEDKSKIIFEEEEKHLKKTQCILRDRIRKNEESKKSDMWGSDNSYFLDNDQKIALSIERNRIKTIEDEIEKIENICKKPYFAKIEIEEYGTFYIGYENCYKYGCNDIISWTHPINKQREINALAIEIEDKATGKKKTHRLLLNRRIYINNGKLIDVSDEYNGETGIKDISDPFLTNILIEKRNESNITNIIQSIQNNQIDIVFHDVKHNIIVQGCPGSGKTMILLHRLQYMMYTIGKYDWTRVKIITPNNEFDKNIENLQHDLNIDAISSMTVNEYYSAIIDSYCAQKNIRATDIKLFGKRATKNDEWREDIASYVYSNEFKRELRYRLNILYKKFSNISHADVVNSFVDAYKDILHENFGDIISHNETIKNHRCTLYACVQYLYLCFGSLIYTDSILLIDEGQDIAANEYQLFKEVNNDKVCFNIFGDINQKTEDNHGINDWNEIPITDVQRFNLNENYRNSLEIAKYYNKQLNFDNLSLGINTHNVERINMNALWGYLYIQLLLGNRTAIVYKEEIEIPENFKRYVSFHTVDSEKISLMTVKEIKGLEFDVVFVYEYSMTNNEKYIAYTRPLNELYVIDDIDRDNRLQHLKNDFIEYIKNIVPNNSYELVLNNVIMNCIKNKIPLYINNIIERFNDFYLKRKNENLIIEKDNLAAVRNSNLKRQVLDTISKNGNWYYYDNDNKNVKFWYDLNRHFSIDEIEYIISCCENSLNAYFLSLNDDLMEKESSFELTDIVAEQKYLFRLPNRQEKESTLKEMVYGTLQSSREYVTLYLYDTTKNAFLKSFDVDCNLNIVREDKVQEFKKVLMKSFLETQYEVISSKLSKLEKKRESDEISVEKRCSIIYQTEDISDFLFQLKSLKDSIILSHEQNELLNNGLIQSLSCFFAGTDFPAKWNGTEFNTIISTLNHIENEDKKTNGEYYTLKDLKTNIAFFMKYVLNTGKNENEIIKGLNNIRMRIAKQVHLLYLKKREIDFEGNTVSVFHNKEEMKNILMQIIYNYLRNKYI